MISAHRLSLLAVFLWLEATGLGIFAVWSGAWWLLPASGMVLLFAGLLTRRAIWVLPLALATVFFWWIQGGNSSPQASTDLPVSYAVLALLAGAACAFFGILSRLSASAEDLLLPRLGQMIVTLHFLTAGLLLADPVLEVSTAKLSGWLTAGLLILLCADTAAKSISRLYTPERHWAELPAPGAFFFFRWLGKDWQACLPVVREDANAFTLKLPEMWMWPAVRRSLPLLAVAAAGIAWLGTGLHQVASGERGVRHRFGTWAAADLAPGLHFSLPHPFGGVRRVDTGRLHEIVLGFRADPGQPILWERAHYEEESMSMVGGGDDFLSISVPIFYRCEQPADFLRSAENAESLLRGAGENVLLRLTAHRPAAEIMTTAREELRQEFKTQLQAELDTRSSGLRVTEVYLRDIHPPVPVAPFFQEVVGAIEEREAFIHTGEEYRNDNLVRYGGNARELVVQANGSAAVRLLAATGETARFTRMSDARREAPRLYELREGFRFFDEALAGAKKVVFDERIRGSMPMHIDLRKVLNPDLLDTSMPKPQSLIPRPVRPQDAFQREIEGFMNADRGEVIAPDYTPPDPDNLLKNPEK